MEHDYRHLSTKFDMDAWLDAADELVPGNHSANDVPASRPFVHMTGPAGEVLLRQWPEGMAVQHVQAIARVLDAMHHADATIPSIRTHPGEEDSVTTLVKDRLYSALDWQAGRPLGRFGGYVDADGRPITLPLPESAHADEVIVQIAATVARAHESSMDVDRTGLPVFTIATLVERVRKYWFEQRRILGDEAADQRDIRRWLRCGNRIIPTASDLIRNELAEFTDTSVVIHNDLWPENVLIEGQQLERKVTGVVGWSHMASSSPVIDLAQLTVHMQGWSAALTEAIIESYATTTILRPAQRRLVPAVAGMMLVERVGHMLTLNYLDQRMIGHEATSVLRSGMKTLLDSLERITHILAPDIDQTQRFKRHQHTPGYSAKYVARNRGARPDGEKRTRRRAK